jgi:hypothetical protein
MPADDVLGLFLKLSGIEGIVLPAPLGTIVWKNARIGISIDSFFG